MVRSLRTGHQSSGHPVNVASGTVFMTREDYSIPGKVPLVWRRRYSTDLLDTPPTLLGPGWTAPYFATLAQVGTEFHFVTPEGYMEIFADPGGAVIKGGIVRNLGTFQELTTLGGRYVVTRWGVDTGKMERYVFNQGRTGEIWPLASIEDVTGRALDMLRDETGRLWGIRQRLETRTLVLSYTPGYQVSGVCFALPDNRLQVLARYEYDQGGRLITAYDALGYADRYEYNHESRMTREIVKDGGVFYFKYDEKGRCVKTSGLDRYDEKSLRYMEHIGWTEVTNSLGSVTRYQWLPSGQVTVEIDPMGAVRRTQYDEQGRIITITDPNNAITRLEYDDCGNRCKTVNSLGHEFTLEYNGSHLPLKLTDPAGQAWKREYDAHNQLIAAQAPIGTRWTYQYDSAGDLIQVTDPNGATKVQRFDKHGALTEASDWAGNMTRYAQDEYGNVAEIATPTGELTRFYYDAVGNQTHVVYSDGSFVVRSFDAAGNLVSVRDCLGRIDSFRYGPCHRILEQTDALGYTTRYLWGTESSLIRSILNPKGETYSFSYDASGHRTREIGFDGRSTSFTYDLAGNCVAFTNGLGQEVRFDRDLLGRIVRKTAADGTSSEIRYDLRGHVVSAITPDVAVTYERDEFGRVVRELQGQHVIERKWDRLGNVEQLTTSLGHQQAFGYDSNGLTARLAIGPDFGIDFVRDAAGREVVRNLPKGVRLETFYDSAGRIREHHAWVAMPTVTGLPRTTVSMGAGKRSRTIVRRRYGYDQTNSLITLSDEHSGELHFVYDQTERLTSVRWNGSRGEEFEYDANGNMTAMEDHGEKRELGYVAGNRLWLNGRTRYFYDDHGRLTRKSRNSGDGTSEHWAYSWDASDQLRSVTKPDGSIWRYTYDALGRRILKIGPGETTQYVWDGNAIIHAITSADSGSSVTTWISEPHRLTPLCRLQDGRIDFVVHDHLGTPRELVSTSGTIAWSAAYKAWGLIESIGIDETRCPCRFQGQWFDHETGLHYNRFRYYDPEVGRYISQDPVRLLAGLNLYTYAWNPVNWLDPFGLADDPSTRYRPGDPLANDEIIVIGGGPGKGREPLRPGIDDRPLPGVSSPGKSASIAVDMTVETEVPQMFGRPANRGDVITAATAEDVRGAGFDVVYAPTERNSRHVRIIAAGNQFNTEGQEELAQALEDKGVKIKKEKTKDKEC